MKSNNFSLRLACQISLVFCLATPVVAGDVAVDPVGPVFVPPLPEIGAPQVSADSIVESINSAREFCQQLADKQYTVDCIAERLANVAQQMPNTGEYAEARAAIEQAAQRLHALAVANKSSTAPVAHAARRGPNKTRTTRPLTPVRNDRRKAVEAEAAKILAETETILLRSAESSASRQISYKRIAEAVGSNKVLLRS